MKGKLVKKWTALALVPWLSITLGCGDADTATQEESTQHETQILELESAESQAAQSQSVETQTAESQAAQSQISESGEEPQALDLTFADLSGYVFEFSSGAGAWSTELTIEKDGYFHGQYHDSDMGDAGEGYDNGTVYSSVFSGHFTDLTKTDDTVWTMEIADISYQDTVGETRIDAIDKIRYIYTGAYGLGDTMSVYWAGTPTADLSGEEMSWVGLWLENTDGESTLTMPVIADAATGEAFYSYDRQSPYKEAKALLESCQYSYEEMQAEIQQATTQGDMNLYAQRMYENNDDCLNQIWTLVKYNTDENEYAAILEEQRAWIAEKEAEEERISAEWEGGSGEPLARYTSLADMTMERCEALVEYLAE